MASGSTAFRATLVWAVACQCLDSGLAALLRPALLPRLAALKPGDPGRLRNVVVAFVHSVCMFGGAVAYLLPRLSPSWPFLPITAVQPNSDEENFYAEIMLGYLVYDFFACVRQGDGFLITAHHLLGMASHSSMRYHNIGGIYMMWVHFAEGSTPFLHVGWVCRKLGYAGGRFCTAVDLAFALLFFVTRVLSAPICLHSLWRHRALWAPHDTLHRGVTAITVAFVLLNYVWWLAILKRLRDFARGKPIKSA